MKARSMKTRIGDSGKYPDPKPRKGWSLWIEDGIWFTAPKIDARKFGRHDYDLGRLRNRFSTVHDCRCGCSMFSSSASGPVDPFGPCPANPKQSGEDSHSTRSHRLNEIVTGNIWLRIKDLARESRHMTAAIAYVSADKYVSFREGDVLVCDASDAAIKSGETSAAVLGRYLNAGTNIYSCRDLHAKVLVLDRFVLVGSCNLSESSARVLRESAVLSSDPSLRSQALAFVHGLTQQGESVDESFIARIARIPVTKRRSVALRQRKTLKFGTRTWVISTVPLSEKLQEAEESVVQPVVEEVGKRLEKPCTEIGEVRWTGKNRFRSLAREGDILIKLHMTGKRVVVSCPLAILKRQDHGKWTRFYHEAADATMPWTAFQRKLHEYGVKHIKKRSTKELTSRDAALVNLIWEQR